MVEHRAGASLSRQLSRAMRSDFTKRRSVLYGVRFWHPCRGAIPSLNYDRGCRCAQPPANFYDPSGVDIARNRTRLHLFHRLPKREMVRYSRFAD